MTDENTTDLDEINMDDIQFDGAWAELGEADQKGLGLVVDKILGGETNVTLTSDELKNALAYAFMAGIVLAEADMMAQMFASMGMPGIDVAELAELIDDDGGDGEGGKNPASEDLH